MNKLKLYIFKINYFLCESIIMSVKFCLVFSKYSYLGKEYNYYKMVEFNLNIFAY